MANKGPFHNLFVFDQLHKFIFGGTVITLQPSLFCGCSICLKNCDCYEKRGRETHENHNGGITQFLYS